MYRLSENSNILFHREKKIPNNTKAIYDTGPEQNVSTIIFSISIKD